MDAIKKLEARYAFLKSEAEKLAGGLNDLAQRATVYHHLFEDSGRNHIFPLIAAHGAMWARGYFQFGMSLGRWCSWQYALSPRVRRERIEQLHAFADAFRDINRRVCIDTYTAYHFTAEFGAHPQAGKFVPSAILIGLNRCHAARRSRRELTTAEKRELFEAAFLNEQETVVGPTIDRAVAGFDWPVMKRLALRPRIRFAYFPVRERLVFRNFSDMDERIARGLFAFDVAARVGWDRVEAALREYEILSAEFFANSARHFASVKDAVLAGG